MEQTSGLVQRLNLADNGVCAWIGPQPNDTEVFLVAFDDNDEPHALDCKKSMVGMLVKAKGAGYEVQAHHESDQSVIEAITLPGYDISPVGHAIRKDFYSVTGSGFPDDVEITFESEWISVTVVPDLVRPHWIFLAELPGSVALGRCHVRLKGQNFNSDAVPIDVYPGPRKHVRVLYPGAPKGDAFTVALVANPILEVEEGGKFIADPIVTDRPGFHDVVTYALTNLLTEAENLLRQEDIDAYIRFVAIFDNVLADSNDSNSLVKLKPPNNLGPRRTRFKDYLARYLEITDVAFALTGSSTHTRASASCSEDDSAGAVTAFTYDGIDRVHGHATKVPGACTLSRYTDQDGLTALHEFGHMFSDCANGAVVDLYVDGNPKGFQVNKKYRANATDPVPIHFGTYNGASHVSDPNRSTIGYPSDWKSYHPSLIDHDRPNLMDNYWEASEETIKDCRFDQITYDLLSDRLRAKVFR